MTGEHMAVLIASLRLSVLSESVESHRNIVLMMYVSYLEENERNCEHFILHLKRIITRENLIQRST